LGPELDTAIYRIAQELISNAIRHGQPSEISVALRVETEGILLTVSDNGLGFETAGGEMGMGLRNIRARVQLHGGMLTVESVPDQGTYAEIFIPLRIKA
jgi:signal transduction histidine kinase